MAAMLRPDATLGHRIPLDELRSSIEDALPDYLRDLQALVDVDCGSYTKAGVDEVGTWVGERLEMLGATVERHAHPELGDTIVGSFEGRSPGATVLVIAHLDTVFDPGTVAQRPFSMQDGRAHGPGVSDMKAGLLSGLYAVAALRDVAARSAATEEPAAPTTVAEWLPLSRLVYIANSDEEIGSPSSTRVIAALAQGADAALVLEAGRENGDIVSARKGHTVLRCTVRGRAAHAGVEPEKGRNAVLEAAHQVVRLQGLNGRWPGVTVNVGVIEGGSRPNIVPERASLEVDLRATSRADLEAAEDAISAIAAAPVVPDVSSEVEVVARHLPMERTIASGRLVEHATTIAHALGFDLRDAATGGASDGNTTSGLGVPTLDGLGPIGGLDHAPGEYVELDSIVPRTTLLAGLIASIGRDAHLGGAQADEDPEVLDG